MALVVYRTEEDVKNAGLDLIRVNDLFFNAETYLDNTYLSNLVLSTVDKAKYNSSLTFIGRSIDLGALNKNMLSTGTKTLLNIINHPDKCFDVCECGDNALSLLPLFKNGSVLWAFPMVA